MRIPKIAVLGAGNVGAASAAAMAARRLGRIHLYDIVPDLAVGKAMDINQASPFFRSDSRVVGADDPQTMADSDVVVVTAGAPRREGMTRQDLLDENRAVLEDLAVRIARHCPSAKVLVVTNPVDLLTWGVHRACPKLNVFGLGCSLDTLRLRFFLAEAADVSVDAVNAMVIGMHSDLMVPLVGHATIGGVAAGQLLSPEAIAQVVTRTREAGTRIVRRLKTRGSFYAAAWTIAEIVEAVVRHKRGVFPLSVACPEHFGYEGVFLALPALVGSGGVEEVLRVDLDDQEGAGLARCAEHMRRSIAAAEDGGEAGRVGPRPADSR